MNINQLPSFLPSASTELRLSYMRNASYLSQEEIKLIINDPSPEVRLALVYRNDIVFNNDQVGFFLEDADPRVRSGALSRAVSNITPSQFSKALLDSDVQVRLSALRWSGIHPTSDQFSLLLKDSDPAIREAAFSIALEGDITPEQYNNGLNDDSSSVRLAASQYPCFIPTSEQIQRTISLSSDSLSAKNPFDIEVLRKWIKRKDVLFTKTDILIGHSSSSLPVSSLFRSHLSYLLRKTTQPIEVELEG